MAIIHGVFRMRWLAFAFISAALPAFADPIPYALQAEGSTVAWETDYGQQVIQGTMPISSADLALDLDVPEQSRITVVMSVANARAAFPFAAEAMRSASVLDAASFPTITFVATRLSAGAGEATVRGNLTIRGQTQPITLDARFFRPPGSAEGDFSRLSVQLTGRLSRAAFGATGFADLVGDEVRLNIVARIAQAD